MATLPRRPLLLGPAALVPAALAPAALAPAALAPAALATTAAAQPASLDDALRLALARRVDAQFCSGIVIGMCDDNGTRFIAHGLTRPGGAPVNEHTSFEIGSVTKLFTNILLADMVLRHEVELATPVSGLLPPGSVVPSWNGTPITLAQLATHRSGLPRLPDDLDTASADPYARYTPARLLAFLARHRLARPPGAVVEYSNLGAGLLGYALSLRAGQSYEELLQSRILRPLGMDSTSSLGRAGPGVATGHDADMTPVPAWHFDALAGAGAIGSTAHDMLRFAQLFLEPGSAGPLRLAARLLMSPAPDGLGLARTVRGVAILEHEGQTGGFHSALTCIPQHRRGALVLSNGAGTPVADLALHACDLRFPLAVIRAPVPLTPAQLDRLIGTYRLSPDVEMLVSRRGDRLMAQLSGQAAARVFPDGEWDASYRIVAATLVFEPGPDGRARRVVLHQDGRAMPGDRMR